MAALPAPLTAPVRSRGPRTVRAVQVVQLLVVVQVVVFALSTVGGRSGEGFDVRLDGWLQGSAYVSCALLLSLRPLLSDVDRGLWRLVAAGIACRAAAFVVALGVVRRLDPPPYPSAADVGWIAMYVFFAAALIGLVRSRFERVTAVLVLDAAVAVFAATAFAAAVVPGVLARLNAAGTPQSAIVVNTLYPLLDVALLLLTLSALLVFRWGPPPAVWVFAAGAVLFAAVDVWYLRALADGTFRPGSPLQALALIANALFAFSAWAPRGRPTVEPGLVPGLAVPSLLALCCVALLLPAAANPRALPTAAIVLAVSGVLAAVARTAISFASVRRGAAAERRESRQALMERLVQAQDAERARIAADVHDDSVQALAAVDLRLQALRRRLRTGAPDELDAVDTVVDAVHQAALRLRSLLFELEVPALETDLPGALEDAAAHIFDDSGTTWTVRGTGLVPLPSSVRVSAYRIAREALVNVRKHADARAVTVDVEASPAGVLVTVLDDGVGRSATRESSPGRRHSGVVGMRDRAVASGGWWTTADGPSGTGTAVTFFLPVTATSREEQYAGDRLGLG